LSAEREEAGDSSPRLPVPVLLRCQLLRRLGRRWFAAEFLATQEGRCRSDNRRAEPAGRAAVADPDACVWQVSDWIDFRRRWTAIGAARPIITTARASTAFRVAGAPGRDAGADAFIARLAVSAAIVRIWVVDAALDCAAGSGTANAGTTVPVDFADLAFRLAGWTRDHAESIFAADETVATGPLRSLIETARIAFDAAGGFGNRADALDTNESIAAFEKGGALSHRTRFAFDCTSGGWYDASTIHADESIAA
jgi:hypothetical protein